MIEAVPLFPTSMSLVSVVVGCFMDLWLVVGDALGRYGDRKIFRRFEGRYSGKKENKSEEFSERRYHAVNDFLEIRMKNRSPRLSRS